MDFLSFLAQFPIDFRRCLHNLFEPDLGMDSDVFLEFRYSFLSVDPIISKDSLQKKQRLKN